MTIVLTPYWDHGVQKLKMARQRTFLKVQHSHQRIDSVVCSAS
jgi:hypothetical protein